MTNSIEPILDMLGFVWIMSGLIVGFAYFIHRLIDARHSKTKEWRNSNITVAAMNLEPVLSIGLPIVTPIMALTFIVYSLLYCFFVLYPKWPNELLHIKQWVRLRVLAGALNFMFWFQHYNLPTCWNLDAGCITPKTGFFYEPVAREFLPIGALLFLFCMIWLALMPNRSNAG